MNIKGTNQIGSPSRSSNLANLISNGARPSSRPYRVAIFSASSREIRQSVEPSQASVDVAIDIFEQAISGALKAIASNQIVNQWIVAERPRSGGTRKRLYPKQRGKPSAPPGTPCSALLQCSISVFVVLQHEYVNEWCNVELRFYSESGRSCQCCPLTAWIEVKEPWAERQCCREVSQMFGDYESPVGSGDSGKFREERSAQCGIPDLVRCQ